MSAKAIKKLAIGPRKGQLLLPKRAEAARLSPSKKEERMSDAERVAAGQTQGETKWSPQGRADLRAPQRSDPPAGRDSPKK